MPASSCPVDDVSSRWTPTISAARIRPAARPPARFTSIANLNVERRHGLRRRVASCNLLFSHSSAPGYSFRRGRTRRQRGCRHRYFVCSLTFFPLSSERSSPRRFDCHTPCGLDVLFLYDSVYWLRCLSIAGLLSELLCYDCVYFVEFI